MNEDLIRCTRCAELKPREQYGANFSKARRKSYRRSHCKSCDVSIAIAYRKTPAGAQSRLVEYRRKFMRNRAFFRAVKSRSKCYFCSEVEVCCLDFHHLDPKQKEFSVGTGKTSSLKKLSAEIAKCICLCANCHRKLHAGLLSLPECIAGIQVQKISEALIEGFMVEMFDGAEVVPAISRRHRIAALEAIKNAA